MPNLTDFTIPKKRLSLKKGTLAFKKRRTIAEAIARKNPGISMASKFKIATSSVKNMKDNEDSKEQE